MVYITISYLDADIMLLTDQIILPDRLRFIVSQISQWPLSAIQISRRKPLYEQYIRGVTRLLNALHTELSGTMIL